MAEDIRQCSTSGERLRAGVDDMRNGVEQSEGPGIAPPRPVIVWCSCSTWPHLAGCSALLATVEASEAAYRKFESRDAAEQSAIRAAMAWEGPRVTRAEREMMEEMGEAVQGYVFTLADSYAHLDTMDAGYIAAEAEAAVRAAILKIVTG